MGSLFVLSHYVSHIPAWHFLYQMTCQLQIRAPLGELIRKGLLAGGGGEGEGGCGQGQFAVRLVTLTFFFMTKFLLIITKLQHKQ